MLLVSMPLVLGLGAPFRSCRPDPLHLSRCRPPVPSHSGDRIADEALAKMNRNYLAEPVVYGSATLIAFAQPFVSLAIFAGLAAYWLRSGTGPRAEVLTGRS